MSHPVRLTAAAEADILEASQWYEDKRPGLSAEFRQAIKHGLDRLALHPERHPTLYRGIRRVLLGRFPYRICYVIRGSEVQVLRVLHVSMDYRTRLDAG